jgi:hypothetical protein
MPKELAELLGTTLQRRQALKLIASAMATATLAACGVAPKSAPLKTNLLVLRGNVRDLLGCDRERLRAIADYLALGNLQEVNILGQYWVKDKPIVYGKPGSDFIGDGFSMVVIAKGESGAAVRAWAKQWSYAVDIDSDGAKSIAPPVPRPQAIPDATATFLVFERRAGVIAPEQILSAPAPQVYIAAHYVLVNDRNRQILVVHAPSRRAVVDWVERWGNRQGVEILALTDLASELERRYRSPSPTRRAEVAALPAPALAPRNIQVSAYHPNGLLLEEDKKLGAYYLRHQATGRFLSVVRINGGLHVATVAIPATDDKWNFTRGTGVSAGNYNLQHQGTSLFIGADKQGNVAFSGQTGLFVSWFSPLTAGQWYSPRVGSSVDSGLFGALTADSRGNVSCKASAGDPGTNWEQWNDYDHPSVTAQMLLDIISTTTHDASWPEDGYSGDLLDAYNGILKLLNGQAPKSSKVTTAALESAKLEAQEKFGGELPPAWTKVFEHLFTELSFLAELEAWYGDGGHVQTLLTETTINNLSLISKVQDMVDPPSESGLEFLLAMLFSALAIALAAAVPPPAGPVVGALIASAWRLYSSASGGTGNILKTTFANLETDLSTHFNALITQREHTRSAIAGNWGKLSSFAGMISDSTLIWPKDTSQVRAAASRQFEISIWQSVSNAIWINSGSGSEGEYRPDAGNDLNSPWKYIIQLPVKFSPRCPGKPLISGWVTNINYIPKSYVPDSLARHLFDDKEGLGINMTDFYVGKNGWAIPS